MNLFNQTAWEWFKNEQNMAKAQAEYLMNQPFPHIVIDGLFNPTMLMYALGDFPEPSPEWWKYDNPLERKYAKNDISDLGVGLKNYIHLMMENRFVSFLEKLTGIQGLIVDHTLNGGGLHQIARGGKLDIHVDYNVHHITKLDRRLNIILYMNLVWNPEWGGALELWDKDMTKCVQKIDPLFNRLVVFSTTEDSNHGHPEELLCPEGVTRKSIAMYLYTNGRPAHEKVLPHSTIFKKRPQDPDDLELDKFREERSRGRVSKK